MHERPSNIPDLIAKIQDLAKTYLPLAREKKRFTRDLLNILVRLESSQYRIASFTRSALMIKEREEDFFTELNFYHALALSWQMAFRASKIDSRSTVIDLCPGSNPKVEIALAQLNFSGTVQLIDSSRSAIRRARQFVGIFQPNYRLTSERTTIWDASGRFDFVVGNHIFDDLLLSHLCTKRHTSLDSIYDSEHRLTEAWQAIANFSDLEIDQLALKLGRKISALSKTTVILTHYPSYVERALKLKKAQNRLNRFISKTISSLTKGKTSRFKRIKPKFTPIKGAWIGEEAFFILERLR